MNTDLGSNHSRRGAGKSLDVTGLVLAGGGSTRFGQDKAMVPVDGSPMVQRVFDALSNVAPRVLVSTGAEDRPYATAGRVRDVFPGRGPLAGLHAGLRACRTTWLMVVACDLPFLRSRDLETILAARTRDAQAVVAVDSSGRLQPLCGCYHVSVLPVAEDMLTSGESAVHGLLERIARTEVPLPDTSLHNVNHPEDLR